MRYIPHTPADRAKMLKAIGVDSVDELFETIPRDLQLGRALAVPGAMAESDLLAHMRDLAEANIPASRAASFVGGGAYHHYVPSAVSQLLLRGELYTAYTPYQPEIAQGTLQIIFEFQTMVSELLGMEIVNASMYDGSTAVAEAALMAMRVARRRPKRVVIGRAVHPQYRAVARRYVESGGAELVEIPWTDAGTTDLDAAERALEKGAAALILGYPTYFGTLDDLGRARALCDKHGALLVATFQDALAFGLLTPPGELGVDIVAGEGQALGVPMSFGGPHLGLFGARGATLRQMPGRLAGETVDSRGNRGFVLTMATREQHIRREKATSNICTNQGLMATAATIYMTLMGPRGLAGVARACHLRAEETKAAIAALDGYSLAFSGPTFHEFVVRTPVPAQQIIDDLAIQQVAAGISLADVDPSLENALLVTATELTTTSDIAELVRALGAL